MPNAAAPAPAPTVDPTAATTPLPVAPEAPPAGGKGPKLPDSLLKSPAIQGLLVGKPGAISASITDFKKRPEAENLMKHKEDLFKAGMGLYRSLDGQTGVIFNRLYVHDDELKQADAAGQLTQLAPPFDSVDHHIAKSGIFHPALDSKHVTPGGFKTAPMPVVPQSANAPMAQSPASVQNKLATARVSNLQPGSPTSGPVPGAGRLLNQVLKPVL